MTQTVSPALVLENRHTGERLEMQRIRRDGQTWLRMRGLLPPHRQGPPLHVHDREAEEFHVRAGTLSAVAEGRELQLQVGETFTFAAGVAHRWWNDGAETLVVDGYVKPVVDLDRYVCGAFDVLNSGVNAERPPLFYMAHLAWRNRRTQALLFMPRALQAIVLPLVVLIGTVLGKYRGTAWPGSPARCTEAPYADADTIDM